MKIISEAVTFRTVHNTTVRLFEEALGTVRWQALHHFGIDEDGHSSKVDEWDRSSCSIRIEFRSLIMSMGMTGAEHVLVFEAWCEKAAE